MNKEKPVLKVQGEFDNLEQIEELLPQIATLQQKYASTYVHKIN
ncbi:hypothetical protein [Pediococcus acidilactici]|nr:hypothetical protein [Pediococcus acidilactici]